MWNMEGMTMTRSLPLRLPPRTTGIIINTSIRLLNVLLCIKKKNVFYFLFNCVSYLREKRIKKEKLTANNKTMQRLASQLGIYL